MSVFHRFQLWLRDGQQERIPGGLRKDAAAVHGQPHHSLGGHLVDPAAHCSLDRRADFRFHQPRRIAARGLSQLQGTPFRLQRRFLPD